MNKAEMTPFQRGFEIARKAGISPDVAGNILSITTAEAGDVMFAPSAIRTIRNAERQNVPEGEIIRGAIEATIRTVQEGQSVVSIDSFPAQLKPQATVFERPKGSR